MVPVRATRAFSSLIVPYLSSSVAVPLHDFPTEGKSRKDCKGDSGRRGDLSSFLKHLKNNPVSFKSLDPILRTAWLGGPGWGWCCEVDLILSSIQVRLNKNRLA